MHVCGREPRGRGGAERRRDGRDEPAFDAAGGVAHCGQCAGEYGRVCAGELCVGGEGRAVVWEADAVGGGADDGEEGGVAGAEGMSGWGGVGIVGRLGGSGGCCIYVVFWGREI